MSSYDYICVLEVLHGAEGLPRYDDTYITTTIYCYICSVRILHYTNIPLQTPTYTFTHTLRGYQKKPKKKKPDAASVVGRLWKLRLDKAWNMRRDDAQWAGVELTLTDVGQRCLVRPHALVA